MSIKGKPQHGHTPRQVRYYSGRVWAGVRKQSGNQVWQGEARARRSHDRVDRDGRPVTPDSASRWDSPVEPPADVVGTGGKETHT